MLRTLAVKTTSPPLKVKTLPNPEKPSRHRDDAAEHSHLDAVEEVHDQEPVRHQPRDAVGHQDPVPLGLEVLGDGVHHASFALEEKLQADLSCELVHRGRQVELQLGFLPTEATANSVTL